MESWTMGMRVMMLILTVGAFILVWQLDHGNEAERPAQKTPRLEREQSTVSQDEEQIAAPVPSPAFLQNGTLKPSAADPGGRGQSFAACIPEAAWRVERTDSELLAAVDAAAIDARFAAGMQSDAWKNETALRNSSAAHDPAPSGERAAAVVFRRIPLPVDLAPGEYHVVNGRGAAFRKTWTAGDLARLGIPETVPEQPWYLLDEQGTNWLFMRAEPIHDVPAVPRSGRTRIADGRGRFSRIMTDSPTFAVGDVEESRLFAFHQTVRELASQAGEEYAMAVCRLESVTGGMCGRIATVLEQCGENWSGLLATVVEEARVIFGARELAPAVAEKPDLTETETPYRTLYRCRQFY